LGTRELWVNVVVPWQQRRRLNEGFPASAAIPRPVERLEQVKRLKSRG
jgi:hypothetical protein